MVRVLLVCAFSLVLCKTASAEDQNNLLKNGSFEGARRYWFEAEKQELVKGDAAHGEYALKIAKGGIQSSAILLQQGKPVTLSFSAKAEKEATMGWQLSPCAREIGTKHGLTWGMRSKHPVKLTSEWKRYSFSFTPTVPQDGFWPQPTYMVQIGDGTAPFLIDAVCVAYDGGKDGYVPRRDIEVLVDCRDMPGFSDPSGNTLAFGATVTLQAFASNPGDKPRDVTLRWQWIDYEGERGLSDAVEKKISIAPGKVVADSVAMKIDFKGMALARVTALENGKVIDSSDLPITCLPYPAKATKPDFRERFGGSFAGGKHCVEILSLAGFGWARWYPHMNWADHQKSGPEEWHWYDTELDILEAKGISTHCVLYGNPKWAMTADKKNPLPKDMQWKANDPAWDDLKTLTNWDKFVVGAVTHYSKRSLIYEIENEPEFDNWSSGYKEEYAKFIIRTARLIKQTDPKAKVMMNQVYGIPSALTSAALKAGAGKYLDVISWHDYHAGWLADATAMRRMRLALDEAGCQNVEIWFNEGWAYTNTAVDEPAPALTGLTSSQGTNSMFDSVAELSANGQEKTILFHLAYENHGQSFWDYSGPGQMLWDWNGYPLPLLAAWNVLNHHIGISKASGFVRPPGANFCVFDDERNGRGVCIAYADRESKADAVVELPWSNLITEDAMGNAAPMTSNKLTLSKTGRPVLLYSPEKINGLAFVEKLKPMDRKNASFVSVAAGNAKSWMLPASWEGSKRGESDGSIVQLNGQPVWKLEQLWPPEPKKVSSYVPMVWTGTDWNVKEGGFGGQPGAALKDSALNLATRAPHGKPQLWRTACVTFVAPEDGEYVLHGSAETRIWDGKNKTTLRMYCKNGEQATEVKNVVIAHLGKASIDGITVTLKAREELNLIPQIEGAYAGGDLKLRDFNISLGGNTAAAVNALPTYTLPLSWDGANKGSAEGNPLSADGKPVWSLYQVWPDKHIYSENYLPLIWSGTDWTVKEHGQGGNPKARVENGGIALSVMGPWSGKEMEHQKIVSLAFIAPKAGVYRITAQASSKPWEGGAKTIKLALLKKDTQRAAELRTFELPRDASPVTIDEKVELTAGHELMLLPLMPDYNNATTVRIENLKITLEP